MQILADSFPTATLVNALSYGDENANCEDGNDGNQIRNRKEAEETETPTQLVELNPNVDLGISSEQRIKSVFPIKPVTVENSENVPVEEPAFNFNVFYKTVSEPQVYVPRDTRYFCPSCWCYVDQTQRRHDQMVHKPPRQSKLKGSTKVQPVNPPSRLPVSPSSYNCSVCPRKFLSKVGLKMHVTKKHRERQETFGIGERENYGKHEPKEEYFCFECGVSISVKEESFIDHLIRHDKLRKKSDREEKRAMDAEIVEWKSRRFVYLNPSDPARNGPNAMILCDRCPFVVFSTSRKYLEHVKVKHGIEA